MLNALKEFILKEKKMIMIGKCGMEECNVWWNGCHVWSNVLLLGFMAMDICDNDDESFS